MRVMTGIKVWRATPRIARMVSCQKMGGVTRAAMISTTKEPMRPSTVKKFTRGRVMAFTKSVSKVAQE
ncbi:hypothetical protein D3C72_2285480 [compost metagenome]